MKPRPAFIAPPPEPIPRNQPFLPRGAPATIITTKHFGADVAAFDQDVALDNLTANIRTGWFQAACVLPGRGPGRQVVMTQRVHAVDDAGELCTVEWTKNETSHA